jgi:hypothetical protein
MVCIPLQGLASCGFHQASVSLTGGVLCRLMTRRGAKV